MSLTTTDLTIAENQASASRSIHTLAIVDHARQLREENAQLRQKIIRLCALLQDANTKIAAISKDANTPDIPYY